MRAANNPVSLAGVVLVNTAAVLWLLLLGGSNPYLGLIHAALLVALILGLILIPLGIKIFGKTEDLVAGGRRIVLVLGITTAANLVIGSHLAYSTVHYMESVDFCGTSCHVMNPEFHALKTGAHSGVKCADCHIAPGAQGWLEAKASGTRQLLSFLRGTYSRPIPTPVHNLPTAEEMCGKCHQLQAPHQDKVRQFVSFNSNEANTREVATYLFKGKKIHEAHRKMPAVTCLTCHNRPAHAFDTPEQAVDRALESGALDAKVPWLRKRVLEAIQKPYTSKEDAFAAFEKDFPGVTAVKSIYESNVSPDRKLAWGQHENNLGHNNYPGCFRCHDGKNGPEADCESCHVEAKLTY